MDIDETRMMLGLVCDKSNRESLDKLSDKEADKWYTLFRTRTDKLFREFNDELGEFITGKGKNE